MLHQGASSSERILAARRRGDLKKTTSLRVVELSDRSSLERVLFFLWRARALSQDCPDLCRVVLFKIT